MKSEADTVEQYLSEIDAKRRVALSKIRQLVVDRVPGVEETMRYGMPTYEYGGHVLCAMASQKQYMSLYVDVDLLAANRERLAGLNLGKSCIRFTSLGALPLEVVEDILEQTYHRIGEEQKRPTGRKDELGDRGIGGS